MTVLRITPTSGPILKVSPTSGPPLRLTADAGPVLHLTALTSTGNAMRGLSGFCGGKPIVKPGGEMVAGGEAPYPYVAEPQGTSGRAEIAATDECVFTIWKDMVLLGYLTFAPGANIGIPTIVSGSVLKGQFVSIRAPIAPDATLANITFLVGEG